jgi:hypothetical protein
MNDQPNNNYTDSALLSLVPGHDLTVLTEALRFPDGYQMSTSVIHGGRGQLTYELGVVHATDEPDGIDFDAPIVRGTADDVQTAVHALLATLKVRDRAYEDQDQQEEPTPWRSRYDGIERPHLVMKHTPGWGCEDVSMNDSEVVHQLFRSDYDPLGLSFTVFENDGYPVSISFGGEIDWTVDTPGELLKLGDKTNELARWLDDCATVTAWCREHDPEASRA